MLEVLLQIDEMQVRNAMMNRAKVQDILYLLCCHGFLERPHSQNESDSEFENLFLCFQDTEVHY